MELQSPKTAKNDRTVKKAKYRDIFKSPDFFMLDLKDRLKGYHLQGGEYVPVLPDQNGRLPCSSLDLSLGMFDGFPRWFDPGGRMLPTGREGEALADQRTEQERQRTEQERQRAEQERQRAEQERQRAEQAEQRAEQAEQRAEQERQRAEQADQRAETLAERLRELGISEEIGDI
jgi:hypothetical protein